MASKTINEYRDRGAIWQVTLDGETIHQTRYATGPRAGEVRSLAQGISPADRKAWREDALAAAEAAGPGALVQYQRVGNGGGAWVDHILIEAS